MRFESAMLADTARHRARGDTAMLRRFIGEANTVRLGGGAAAVAVLIAVGPLLLDLFGPDFRAGQFALVVLLLAQLIAVMSGPTAQVLSVSGGERGCAFAVARPCRRRCYSKYRLFQCLGWTVRRSPRSGER